LFAALREGHGVALPGADFLTESLRRAGRGGIEAKHIGRGVIDVSSASISRSELRHRLQLWVEASATPMPRKLVITSKT